MIILCTGSKNGIKTKGNSASGLPRIKYNIAIKNGKKCKLSICLNRVFDRNCFINKYTKGPYNNGNRYDKVYKGLRLLSNQILLITLSVICKIIIMRYATRKK